ncbi:hypothetical protein T06_14486 [Trichinella sp. T6]|nr:hypothetical protein T06_14486 [Trichinella sp. T6]
MEGNGMLPVRWSGPHSTGLSPATCPNPAGECSEQRNQGPPSPGDEGTPSQTITVGDGLHPTLLWAKGAPLRAGSMVAPAGKLEGKDTRHRGAERGRTGDLGYDLLRFFVKVIDWQTQEITFLF